MPRELNAMRLILTLMSHQSQLISYSFPLSTCTFIQPNFPHKTYLFFSHPVFFILLLISCFLYCEAMAHAQSGPIDGSLLCLQDNRISNQVWEDQERMIRSRCNSAWAFTHLDHIDNYVKNLINEIGFDHVITIK